MLEEGSRRSNTWKKPLWLERGRRGCELRTFLGVENLKTAQQSAEPARALCMGCVCLPGSHTHEVRKRE